MVLCYMISFILEIQIPLLLFFITQFFSYGVLLCSLKKKLHMALGNLINLSEMLQNQVFKKKYASFVKFQQEIVI